MLRWVVTGPAGAGKSLVVDWLAEKGAAIIDADSLGHDLLKRSDIQSAIINNFGREYLRGGVVDRRALGEMVFADAAKLACLNALMHPSLAAAIVARFAELETEGSRDLAVLEAAVYFLLPPTVSMDMTIAVVAPEKTRLRRLIASRGWQADEAQLRVAAQRSLAACWSRADVVLENDASVADLRRRVEDVLAKHW